MRAIGSVLSILAFALTACVTPVTVAPRVAATPRPGAAPRSTILPLAPAESLAAATPRLSAPDRPSGNPAATEVRATPRPTLTPRPTATPRPPTATPRPPGRGVELAQAVAQKLVEAKVSGNGLQRADISVKSLTAESLDIKVLAGTLLAPGSRSVQTMVVRNARTLKLDGAGDTDAASLDVACASMHLGTPGKSDLFTIRAPQSGDLVKLVELPAFLKETFRVQQFAVWTITDNPTAKGFVRLGTSGVGSGPSADQLATIKALFVAAGINPAKYQALPR